MNLQDWKASKIYSFTRHCDEQQLFYGYRKINALRAMNWSHANTTLELLIDAAYCLDSQVSEAVWLEEQHYEQLAERERNTYPERFLW